MAKTIEQLKAQSAEVKNATVVGENTATRVGNLFNDIVEKIEQETADGATTTAKLAPLAVTTEKLANGAVTEDKLNNVFLEKTPEVKDCSSLADLDISDERGNVIARFSGGEFQTKNFDSAKTPAQTEDNSEPELQISDEQGNTIAEFNKGNFRTKEFDSRMVQSQEGTEDSDLDISDERGNVIARFSGGEFQTKNFDSRNGGGGGFVNVKTYGAKGDGTIDDTVALKKAFKKCGLIIIPSGTYIVTSPIDIYSNTTVIMAPDAVIKRRGNFMCLLSAYFTADTTEYNGVQNFSIYGGTIDMGTDQNYGGSCVALMHCYNITFKGVTFMHVHESEHFIDMPAVKKVRIKDCLFTEMQTRYSSTEQIQLDGAINNIGYPYRTFAASSPCYDKAGCVDIEICGCTFNLNEYSPAVGNHNPSHHYDINIHDNVINGPGIDVATLDRGAFAFTTHSAYYNANNNTDRCIIHHNIINDCYRGFAFLTTVDGENTNRIWIKDNLFNNIGRIRVNEDETVGIFSNNIEITT